VNDGETLNKNLAKDSKTDNRCEMAECTATKAIWLIKVDAKKKVGSMVVWLKSKVDADYLLRTDTATFGPCYHCNRYGHKRASCTSQIRCAICSKGHSQGDCPEKDCPRCAARGDAHTVFD
jgi:hypothetical protein